MTVKNSLEDIVTDYGSIKEKAKSHIVNSLTGIVFYTPLMFAYETLAKGYSIEESVEIRGKSAVLGLVLYGAYGHFRNLFSHLTRTTKESSEKRKAIVEIASAYIFNTIAYTGILMHSGAEPLDATATALGGTLLVGLTGRSYGRVLDKIRKKFNLQSVYD